MESTVTTTEPMGVIDEPDVTTTTAKPTTTTLVATTTAPSSTSSVPNMAASFRLSTNNVAPGDEVTLIWSIDYAETAQIRNPEGVMLPIPLEGEWVVSHPEGRFKYSLVAFRGSEEEELGSQTIQVIVPRGSWQQTTHVDPFTDQYQSYLHLVSTTTINADWPYDSEYATLTLFCRGNQLGGYLNWHGGYIADPKVVYRVDTLAAVTRYEGELTSNEGVWFWNTRGVIADLLRGES